MKTLIINGSPKGKDGNTKIFIDRFVRGMKAPYEICYAVKEDPLQIAQYIQQFDSVIIFMPLYVHAIPGIMMKLIECLEPALEDGKAMGFVVQSGFMESAQSKYLERYLSVLSKNLNYTYLGTVIRGGSAGTYMMPEKMNKKLFKQLSGLGEYFDSNNSFVVEIVSEMGKPNKLSKSKSKQLQFFSKIGLGEAMFWNMMLRQNNAKDKRFDKPFASEPSELGGQQK